MHPSCFQLLDQELTYRFIISPRHDRIVSVANRRAAVFSASGQQAYQLPVLDHASGATFSAAGDTLFVAGNEYYGHFHLLALDATSGSILRQGEARSDSLSGAYELVGTAAEPWLYVLIDRPRTLTVAVFERNTLQQVGLLSSASAHCASSYCEFVMAFIDRATATLYLVEAPAAKPTFPRRFRSSASTSSL